MDSQDHSKKNSSSGHDNQAVHVCHKCGWPFPNPHPSAKHRRAHKKVCGTIEGYKLIESGARPPHTAVSDDDLASDKDQRTPSPKIEKRSVKELLSSGGVGEKSNASEDEVFADAVTEFSDSGVSPGMEERIKEPNKVVEKLIKTDPNESLSLKVDATADTFAPPNDTKPSCQEVCEIAKAQSESCISLHGTTSEEVPFGSRAIVGPQFESLPLKSETPTDIDDINVQINGGIEQEPVIHGNDDLDIDKSLTDSIEPHGKFAKDESKLEFNLEETGNQTLDALTQKCLMHKEDQEGASGLEETKRKSSDFLTPETVVQEPVTTAHKLAVGDEQTLGLSSAGGVVERKKGGSGEFNLEDMDFSAPDPAQDIDGSGYSNIIEVESEREDMKEQKEENTVCHLDEAQKDCMQVNNITHQKEATNCNSPEEVKQNMDSLSVPRNLPVTDNVESIIQGCKDYNLLKSPLPLELASAEVISLVQDDNKAANAQEGHPGLSSGHPSGSIESSPDLNALKDDIKEQGVENSIQKKDDISGHLIGSIENSSANSNALKEDLNEQGVENSTRREDDISGLLDRSREYLKSCSFEARSDAPGTEKQKAQTSSSSEGFHLYSNDGNPSDRKSAVFAEEVQQTTNVCEGENAGDNEMNENEKYVMARNETSKEPIEDELSTSSKTIQELADKFFLSEGKKATGELKCEGNRDHERATVESFDVARCKSTEVGGVGNSVKNTEATLDAAWQLPESTDLDSVPDKAHANMELINSSLQNCGDESSQGALHGIETGNITNVVESVDFTVKDIDGDHDGSLLASKENPVDSMSKETAHLHVEPEVSHKSSVNVEFTNTREAVKSVSDCNSEPSQEGDHRFKDQHDGIPAIDISFPSRNQVDSLEGNWGSISGSVVSTQSDATPTAHAGGLPSSVSQPPQKLEADLQMPDNATNECHPDKSDILEPPSLVTTVESEDYVSKKATPEIQTAANIQPQKPEDLQAGCSPSLSNVVNDTQGRKENEEAVAKVGNWSSGNHHGPLKNLLGEAMSPNTKQVPTVTQSNATVTKSNAAEVTTVNAILRFEEPNDQAANQEMEKEWNSPARYPSQIKKEKRKGKPYWVPFVCCSSVHRDL